MCGWMSRTLGGRSGSTRDSQFGNVSRGAYVGYANRPIQRSDVQGAHKSRAYKNLLIRVWGNYDLLS